MGTSWVVGGDNIGLKASVPRVEHPASGTHGLLSITAFPSRYPSH